MRKQSKVRKYVLMAVFSSIAFVLMMLNFPFPGLPPFLKIDFSEVPALLAAIMFGPAAGVGVEGLKNLIHYGIQGSPAGFPIGQVANFIAGVLFVVPTSLVFRKLRTKRGLTMGLLLGTAVMTALMALFNYFIILPAYTALLNWEMTAVYMQNLVLTGIIPFNIIKGIFVTVLFLVLFTKLQPWIQKQEKYS